MIRSMTGFGRAKYDIDGRQYTVEIKSVNNRYCDVSVKIPRSISYLEEKVKAEVSKEYLEEKLMFSLPFITIAQKEKQLNSIMN